MQLIQDAKTIRKQYLLPLYFRFQFSGPRPIFPELPGWHALKKIVQETCTRTPPPDARDQNWAVWLVGCVMCLKRWKNSHWIELHYRSKFLVQVYSC